MKFIYTSDLHGDKRKYETLISLCKENNIYTIVVGGDLFHKHAPKRIPVQIDFINNYLKDYYKKLEHEGITYIGVVGNDDLEIPCVVYYEMIKEFPNVHSVEVEPYSIDGISFIGSSYVLDAPFKRKDHIAIEEGLEMPPQKSDVIYVDKCQKEISVDEWKELRETYPKMEDIVASLPKGKEGDKVIYILHDPPAFSGLDYCNDGCKAGSKAIYNFLLNSNAYMSLHGHIHEAYDLSGVWNKKIGKTVAIQAGQTELGDDHFVYVVIDTDKNTYERYCIVID